MNIREANAEDIEPIASLYVMNWKKTYVGLLPDNFLNGLTVNEGIKKWQEYLNKEKHRIFVAYENEKILGFSACKEWSYVNILDTKSQTFLCCTSS